MARQTFNIQYTVFTKLNHSSSVELQP